jgi:hypothetical protein
MVRPAHAHVLSIYSTAVEPPAATRFETGLVIPGVRLALETRFADQNR